MDVADEAILVQECLVGRRSIGGIGPHPARRIALVEQALAQTTALIGSRICGRPLADEAETAIDRDMVLIAKERDWSLMRNSARSSERLLVAWMTRILNISTGRRVAARFRPVRAAERRI
jgi:hypothetical protein